MWTNTSDNTGKMRTQYSFGIMGYNGTTTKVEISITKFFNRTLIDLINITGSLNAFSVSPMCRIVVFSFVFFFCCVMLVDWQLYLRGQQHYDTGDQADAKSGSEPR